MTGIIRGPQSKEHKDKHSSAVKGLVPWNKNVPRTEESRAKQSATNKGRPWTEARRKAQRERQTKLTKEVSCSK